MPSGSPPPKAAKTKRKKPSVKDLSAHWALPDSVGRPLKRNRGHLAPRLTTTSPTAKPPSALPPGRWVTHPPAAFSDCAKENLLTTSIHGGSAKHPSKGFQGGRTAGLCGTSCRQVRVKKQIQEANTKTTTRKKKMDSTRGRGAALLPQ